MCLAGVEPLFADVPNIYTLTFDDLTAGSPTPPVPNGYYGFSWNNWDVIDGSAYVGGYKAGVVSGPNVIFAPYGDPSSIVRQDYFNLISAYMTAAWTEGLQLEVKGLRDTSVLYDNVYTLSASAHTLLNFNFTGINEVDFQVVGTPSQYVMDNLVVGIVPEPTTMALGLASLSIWFLFTLESRRTKHANISVEL
jgi:hypothetical protein